MLVGRPLASRGRFEGRGYRRVFDSASRDFEIAGFNAELAEVWSSKGAQCSIRGGAENCPGCTPLHGIRNSLLLILSSPLRNRHNTSAVQEKKRKNSIPFTGDDGRGSRNPPRLLASSAGKPFEDRTLRALRVEFCCSTAVSIGMVSSAHGIIHVHEATKTALSLRLVYS